MAIWKVGAFYIFLWAIDLRISLFSKGCFTFREIRDEISWDFKPSSEMDMAVSRFLFLQFCLRSEQNMMLRAQACKNCGVTRKMAWIEFDRNMVVKIHANLESWSILHFPLSCWFANLTVLKGVLHFSRNPRRFLMRLQSQLLNGHGWLGLLISYFSFVFVLSKTWS